MADKRRVRLNTLLDEIATNDNTVKSIFDAADARDGVETPDEKAQLKALSIKNNDLLNEAEELKAVLKIREESEGRGTPQASGQGHAGASASQQRNGAYKSLGEVFVEDPELKAWLDSKGHGLSGTGRKKIESPAVEVKSFFGRHLRGLLTSSGDNTGEAAASAGAFVFPEFKPIVDQFYQRPLTIRDLITIGETGSDTIEYVRVTGVTNAAAGVAEAANTTDGNASGRKPESDMDFERVVENVKTIAHWIPATSRALQDAPQLRSYIDAFLRYGIDEQLEDQLVNGAGGDDLTGIFETPNILSQAFSTDILETTRKARTKVRVQGRTIPTAFVLHPNDWEIIDLTKDGEDRYYFGGPLAMGTKTLWGLPVIESEAVAEGQGLCANFKMAILWDRMQSAISVSNSHNDFFIRNLVAILCEMRAAFGVIRPEAFCEIETQAAS
jgi:HK97 family phage major capsid protein